MTVPNLLTLLRLCALAPALFALIACGRPACLDAAVVVLAISGLTDALDGALARRLNQHSDLGRRMDPIVDKIIVCGGFIMALKLDAGLPHWVVAVVAAREFFVSGVRSFMESQGVAYGSFWWLGRQKIVCQYAALAWLCLFAGHWRGRAWAGPVGLIVIYLMLASTVLSGLLHVVNARRAWRRAGRA